MTAPFLHIRTPHQTEETVRHGVCGGCYPPGSSYAEALCGTVKPPSVTITRNAGGRSTIECVVCIDIGHATRCPVCGIGWT